MNKMKYILTTLLAVTIAAPVFAQNINAQKDEFSKALQGQIEKAAAKEKNTLNLKSQKIEFSAEKVEKIIALMKKSGKFTEKDVEVVKHCFENDQADLALLLIISKLLKDKQDQDAVAVQKTEESSWLSAVFGGKYPGETDDSYRCRMEMKKYPAAQPFK